MSKYNKPNKSRLMRPLKASNILEKSNKAVALKYNKDGDMAPVVIASGYGEVAERIINIAENRGIPVYRDDSASSMLCMLDVGTTIPEELYEVVAAIYAHILRTASKTVKPSSQTTSSTTQNNSSSVDDDNNDNNSEVE